MTADILETDKTDFVSPEFTLEPLSYLNRIREEEPIHWNDRHKAWFVTRFGDVTDGFKDDRLSANRLKVFRERRLSESQQETIGRSIGILETWMAFQDEPEHRRLRSIVHKAFTPQVVAQMDASIHELVRARVAVVAEKLEKDPTAPIDLMQEIAYQIPGPIVCRMLGVSEDDQDKFMDWSEEISTVIGGFVADDNRMEKAHKAVRELEDYLTQVIESTSSDEDNLMARLVAAENEGDKLSREEAIGTGILVLFGGNRTTAGMIGNGLRALLLNPHALKQFQADPSLSSSVLEEVMRWESHTKVTVRIVKEDFEWHGKQLKVGQRVFLSPMAANHDPSVFENPGEFDILRQNSRRHLAFGTGIHSCLGSTLARMELKIVFSEMLPLLDKMKMIDPKSQWIPAIVNRAQKEMLVVGR